MKYEAKKKIFDDYRFVGIHIQSENLFISSHDSDLHLEGFVMMMLWEQEKKKFEFGLGGSFKVQDKD